MSSSPNGRSPRLMRKFSSVVKVKPLRVAILGQAAVGKSALTVRFLTRRFIGEYDPTLEKKYTFNTEVDSEWAPFEILDTAGQDAKERIRFQEEESLRFEENIKWADSYVLMYSVTDRCSFEECRRFKFLINIHAKRTRRISVGGVGRQLGLPVMLVGNQNDLLQDRMVSAEEGQRLAFELGCLAFHEISVRESYEEVRDVFDALYRMCRKSKTPELNKRIVPPPENIMVPSMVRRFSRTSSLSRKFVGRIMPSFHAPKELESPSPESDEDSGSK